MSVSRFVLRAACGQMKATHRLNATTRSFEGTKVVLDVNQVVTIGANCIREISEPIHTLDVRLLVLGPFWYRISSNSFQ